MTTTPTKLQGSHPLSAQDIANRWCGHLRDGGASRLHHTFEQVRQIHADRFEDWLSRQWGRYRTRASIFLQLVDPRSSGKSHTAFCRALGHAVNPTYNQILEAWRAAIDQIPLHEVLRDYTELNSEYTFTYYRPTDDPPRGIEHAHFLR